MGKTLNKIWEVIKFIFLYFVFSVVMYKSTENLFKLAGFSKTNNLTVITAGIGVALTLFVFVKIFYKDDNILEDLKQKDSKGMYFDSIMIAIISTIAILAFTTIIPKPQSSNQTTDMLRQSIWLMGFFSIFIAPFAEEILFRKILLSRSNVFISALFFGSLHAQVSSDIYSSLYPAIPTFLLGLVWGYRYKKTESIKQTILMHFTYNIIIVDLVAASKWL